METWRGKNCKSGSLTWKGLLLCFFAFLIYPRIFSFLKILCYQASLGFLILTNILIPFLLLVRFLSSSSISLLRTESALSLSSRFRTAELKEREGGREEGRDRVDPRREKRKKRKEAFFAPFSSSSSELDFPLFPLSSSLPRGVPSRGGGGNGGTIVLLDAPLPPLFSPFPHFCSPALRDSALIRKGRRG